MRKHLLLLAALGVAATAAPAPAQPLRASQDRMEAFRGVRQGSLLPLNVIRERVEDQFPGSRMIAADLVGATYRVRLMRGSDLMIVDVDARSGRLLRCLGRC